MKKLLLLFFITLTISQQAEITNIQASQRTDGSQIVDITYDLLPDPVFEFFEITVLVSLDGGENYTPMTNVSGDLGDIIEPGNGKTLTWNFGQQFGETYSDQIKIKIEGLSYALIDNNSNQELPFEMVTVAAGEYTLGENDEIRTIDYDYEIMKYEVTDQDYVLFMLDKLSSGDDGGPNVSINSNYLTGYYPGDANYPAGDYTYIRFGDSKISWNGEIFEVQEGNVNHPVTGVTWFGAWAFATYYGMEIPDQYEWEKAARGNTGFDYPWGDEISSINANYNEYFDSTVSIGSYDGNTQLNLPDYSSGYYESSIPNAFWYKKVDDTYYFYINKDFNGSIYFEIEGQLNCNYGNSDNCYLGLINPFSFENGNHFFSSQGSCSNVHNVYLHDSNGSQLEVVVYSDPAQTINSISTTSENSVSPFGTYDMSGNVWEIVKNEDESYFIRGGAYNNNSEQVKSWYQESYNSSNSSGKIGFRCIRKINQSQFRTVPKDKPKEYYLNKKNNIQKSNIKK